jgi:hypothetical protein
LKLKVIASLALVALFSFMQPVAAQALSTATVVAADSYRSISGAGTHYLLDTATDASGNLYVLGHANNNFVNMTGVTTTVFNHQWSQTDNIYLAKYSPTASLLWIQEIDNTMNEAGYAMAVSSSGQIAITGRMCAPLNIPPSISLTQISQTCDGFLAVLDSDGQGLWGKVLGDPSSSHPNQWVTNVTFDAAGNIYFAAFFESMDFISAYGIDGITFTNPSGVDYQGAVIVKTNSSGLVTWIKPLRKGVYVADKGLKATTDGVYAAGFFNFAAAFDGLGTYTPVGNDGFVAKIANSNQQFSNLKIIGGTGDQTINGVGVDSTGALIVGARVAGTGVLNSVNYASAGLVDHVVFKLSGAGWVTDWARQISSVGNDFYGTLNLGSAGTFVSANAGSSNGLLVGLEPDGQIAWAKQTTSTSTGYSSLNAGVSVFGNSVYAGGQSSGNQTTIDGITVTGNSYGSAYWIKVTTSALGGSIQGNSVSAQTPATAIDVTNVSPRVLPATHELTSVLISGRDLDQVKTAEVAGKIISFELQKNGQLKLFVPNVGTAWQDLKLTGSAFKYVLQAAFRTEVISEISVAKFWSAIQLRKTIAQIQTAKSNLLGSASFTCSVSVPTQLSAKQAAIQIRLAKNFCSSLHVKSNFVITKLGDATQLKILVRG